MYQFNCTKTFRFKTLRALVLVLVVVVCNGLHCYVCCYCLGWLVCLRLILSPWKVGERVRGKRWDRENSLILLTTEWLAASYPYVALIERPRGWSWLPEITLSHCSKSNHNYCWHGSPFHGDFLPFGWVIFHESPKNVLQTTRDVLAVCCAGTYFLC